MRTERIVACCLAAVAAAAAASACTSATVEERPAATCDDGQQDGAETGLDCGGTCPNPCSTVTPRDQDAGTSEPADFDATTDGGETDEGCGGPNAPKCAAGKKCVVDSDCVGACNYAHRCVDAPSCKPHLGGDTCGTGEVGQSGTHHESCCRTLPVTGYVDPTHPGKTVYLDKYEITTGRIRAFIADIEAQYAGKPNIKRWILENTPPVWDASWTKFLPTDHDDGTTVHVDRNLLGDRRGIPGDPPVPPEDGDQRTGLDFQFNSELFVYLHGNNCATRAPDSYGFPTWFYPAKVLAKLGPDFPPRADGTTLSGAFIPASEHLEVKAMNCITNAMLQAFCHWDGGQLATSEVLDYVTASPPELGNMPGCGTQIGTEYPPTTDKSMKGGRCADLALINATFDAGGTLPHAGSPLNVNNYIFPFFPQGTEYDKAWEISAPGRGSLAAGGEQTDMVRIHPGDEPWMDLAGNLSESVLTTKNGAFTGKFGLKYRGIGYQSARSELNMKTDWPGEGGLARIERAEAKAAWMGGRCMRFK